MRGRRSKVHAFITLLGTTQLENSTPTSLPDLDLSYQPILYYVKIGQSSRSIKSTRILAKRNEAANLTFPQYDFSQNEQPVIGARVLTCRRIPRFFINLEAITIHPMNRRPSAPPRGSLRGIARIHCGCSKRRTRPMRKKMKVTS